MIDYKKTPLNLSDGQIKWVEETYASMSFEEKVGQLFCTSAASLNDKTIEDLTKNKKVGGLMIRPLAVKGLKETIGKLQKSSKIPLFVAANLEQGGVGAINEGTYYAMPMGATATNDMESGYRLGKISCREAASVGVNWGFAPIVDIDMNYRNPITNIRAFANNADTVIKMSRGFIKGANEEGVLPTIKHFPGDGTDERDQHLLVSVNQLRVKEWYDTFGKVYQTLIDEGASTLMTGHIAQPAVARDIDPNVSKQEAFAPASQSKTLVTKLLREKMGFNGLIVTDSTLMVGYMQTMPRKKAIPTSIAAGVDMILFSRSLAEDMEYMKEGVKSGLISETRFEEAVKRVLATKASINLNIKHKNGAIVPSVDPLEVINKEETRNWVRECADKAVTLVKDNRKLLPLNPNKGKRVYLNVIENYADNKSPFAKNIKERLEKEGFEVDLRKRELDVNPAKMLSGIPSFALLRAMKEIMGNTDDFVKKYDMCMIVLNEETVSNATVVRVNWKVLFGMGNDIPWYAGEMPLVVVSVANPYHLLDIPMCHTYINTYSNNKETLDALFDKLMGRSEFKGVSPVDAFCGHEDCSL